MVKLGMEYWYVSEIFELQVQIYRPNNLNNTPKTHIKISNENLVSITVNCMSISSTR